MILIGGIQETRTMLSDVLGWFNKEITSLSVDKLDSFTNRWIKRMAKIVKWNYKIES